MPNPAKRSFAVVAVALAMAAGCADPNTSAKSPVMAGYEAARPVGFYRLVFDEYHGLGQQTLQRSAVSWKMLAAATLAYRRQTEPALPLTEAAFVSLLTARYGFVLPARIA